MSDDGNWQMNAILAIYNLGFWKAAGRQHVCNHRGAKAACHLQLINSPLQSTNCCSGTGCSCLNRCLGSCKAWRFIRQPGFRVPCGIIHAATRGCGRWWCSCPWETAFSTGMGAVTEFLADCSGKRKLPGTLSQRPCQCMLLRLSYSPLSRPVAPASLGGAPAGVRLYNNNVYVYTLLCRRTPAGACTVKTAFYIHTRYVQCRILWTTALQAKSYQDRRQVMK